MRALWMALLTVVMMTGCGAREEQQPRNPVLQSSRTALEDPGLRGRAWDAPLHGVLAAGPSHSLALDADGRLWAWGFNATGQLGDGTTKNRSLPVKVVGLDQVKSVATGRMHTVALREDGTVWAWGNNQAGQLGQTPSYLSNPTPARVPGLTGVAAIAAGESHSLALREDGTVWAWGDNIYGQVGQPAGYEPISTPAQVAALTGVVAIAAHGRYTLAVREDGTVWGWGANFNSQLGKPSNYEPNPLPSQVPELTGVVALSAGDSHVLALRADGTAWAWGANHAGQLGHPRYYEPNPTPVQVPELTDVVSLAAGLEFSLALRADGTVWAWGLNTSFQFGNGTTLSSHTPQQVPGLKHVVSLVADRHPLAMSKDGAVWGWGGNANGQLGTGTELRPTPVRVLGLSGAKTVSVGGEHVLTLRTDGTVWSWGNNYGGQLGDGTSTPRSAPVQVLNLSEVVAISAGGAHSLALRADGTVWGWGHGHEGQLGGSGLPRGRSVPALVPGLTDVVAIGASGTHSLALRVDGTVWAWGSNFNGQLGRPANYTPNPTPAQVPGLTNVVALETSGAYVLALRADGTVWAWGSNAYGQLGRPANYTPNPTPAQVPGLTGVVALSAAFQHVLALREDGTVWAWGANWQGQLGDGTQTHRFTPAPVPGLTGVTDITTATGSSLVVRQDGSVWGFGNNTYHLMADTDQSVYLSPIQRPELAGVTALASGMWTVLALGEDGTVQAWGSNAFDQIGDGVSSFHTTPVRTRLPCRFTGMPSRDHRASEVEHCPAAP